MKVIVGCKLLAEEQDIVINKDGTLDTSKAAPKISQFDLNAIQTAIDIKNYVENLSITALSVGGKYLENTKAKKDILSRGVDELVAVADETYENILPHQTASILASVAKTEGFDLIICADASGDLYAQQTGVRLGALLDIPTINGVSKIVSLDDKKIVVERALENEIEVLEIILPAAISVSSDINIPAIVGMKAILKAGKKPSRKIEFGSLVATSEDMVLLNKIEAPKQKDRLHKIIEGDNDENIIQFVEILRKVIN